VPARPKTPKKTAAAKEAKAPRTTKKASAASKSKAMDEDETTKNETDDSDGDSDAGSAGDEDGEAAEAEHVDAEVVTDEEPEELSPDEDHHPRGSKPPRSAPLSSDTGMERLDPMAAYLREIQRHRLLTPEETHDLAVKFGQNQDAALAARLVTSNLRLVVKIAYEYRRAYKNIMDLVQEGNIGLMQAVKRYDPYRGVKLSSYAAWWIRAYILRFILNNWRLVKLGTTQAQRKLFFNLKKTRAELTALGIDPSDEEVAKRLNVPQSDVSEMEVRLQASEKSLDAPVGDADGRSITRVDMMPATGAGPESMMADQELQALLKEKLDVFRHTLAGKDKELAIFDERLAADEPLTLQQLGERFHISRERVRQLEQRLMSKLRDFLKREMGDATELA
jgi:RNA polymerase sigma-32 factor